MQTRWQERAALALGGANESGNADSALWVRLADCDVYADLTRWGDLRLTVMGADGHCIGAGWIDGAGKLTQDLPHWTMPLVASEFLR